MMDFITKGMMKIVKLIILGQAVFLSMGSSLAMHRPMYDDWNRYSDEETSSDDGSSSEEWISRQSYRKHRPRGGWRTGRWSKKGNFRRENRGWRRETGGFNNNNSNDQVDRDEEIAYTLQLNELSKTSFVDNQITEDENMAYTLQLRELEYKLDDSRIRADEEFARELLHEEQEDQNPVEIDNSANEVDLANESEEASAEECSICFEDVSDLTMMTTPCCNQQNLICVPCWEQSMELSKVCPLCQVNQEETL